MSRRKCAPSCPRRRILLAEHREHDAPQANEIRTEEAADKKAEREHDTEGRRLNGDRLYLGTV